MDENSCLKVAELMGEVGLMLMAFDGVWFGFVVLVGVNHSGVMTVFEERLSSWTCCSRYFQVIQESVSVFVVDI